MNRSPLRLSLILLLLAGCSKDPGPSDTATETGEAKGGVVLAAEATTEEPEGRLYPSRRCGECHGRQRKEWEDSAHARSNGEVFASVLAHVPADARSQCSGCHVPLETAGRRVAKDGVGCDACHTATAHAQGSQGQVLTLSPELATRFGPYKDSQDHHFHRVAFSEFVVGEDLCASCHQDPEGTKVPTYTTVSEWRDVPDRVECNACHMPPLRAVAAKGEQIRTVSRHDFHPDKASALAEAFSLRWTVLPEGRAAQIELVNDGAGHHLPTGRPERRLVLEVEWQDAQRGSLQTAQRSYGRRLVNEAGAPVPSFLATREAADERLPAGAPRVERFDIPEGARAAVIRLRYQRFDPALANYFGNSDSLLVLERREAL